MQAYDLPDDLRDFIAAQIDSVAHLEALLLLMGNRDRTWSADATAQRLYISAGRTAEILSALAESGFVETERGEYRFACRMPELERMVLRLAEAYRQRLIQVTNLIHAKPKRIRAFADAFRLRKGD